MSQQHDLSIIVVKLFHGRGKPAFQFVPGGGRGRRQFAVGQLADQISLRMILPLGNRQRHLAIDAAVAGDTMAAMGVDEAIPGQS